MASINPATQSYVDSLIAEREREYAKIRTFRDYADGEHRDYMTDEQRALLVGEDEAGNPNPAPEIRINVCATVLDAETDRLEVKAIEVEVEDNEATAEALSELAWKRWKASRMDEGQQNIHFGACRDGNAYAMVWWDETTQQSRMVFNRAYDGDSSGTEVLYQDDDPNQPLCAVKIWTVQRPIVGNAETGRVQRKNIYYPGHIERWINPNSQGKFSNAAWRPLREGDPDWNPSLVTGAFADVYGNQYEATFNWWTDTGDQNGVPLGIPVFHFRRQSRGSAYGRSLLMDIAPGLQDAINLTAISLQAATILNGFKVTTATKFDPNTSAISVYPGAILYNSQDGSFGQLQETNLLQLTEVLNSYIKHAATLTSTPLSFFNQTGTVAAEGTQKQLEIALLAKTRRNQTGFGNAYEDAVRMMLKLEAVFGTEVSLSLDEIDALDIRTEWESAQVRNEREVAEIAILHHEKLQVPLDVAWAEAGYTPDEINAMRENAEIRRNQAMGALVQQIAQMGRSEGTSEPDARAVTTDSANRPADRAAA